MKGLVVVNPEVLIARTLERGGRYAPGLDFIRWRLNELRTEIRLAAIFWDIPARDIALTRAEHLAEVRRANKSHKYPGAFANSGGQLRVVGGQPANQPEKVNP